MISTSEFNLVTLAGVSLSRSWAKHRLDTPFSFTDYYCHHLNLDHHRDLIPAPTATWDREREWHSEDIVLSDCVWDDLVKDAAMHWVSLKNMVGNPQIADRKVFQNLFKKALNSSCSSGNFGTNQMCSTTCESCYPKLKRSSTLVFCVTLVSGMNSLYCIYIKPNKINF